jgi:transcriptional regulator with XRE-family HTH domain
MAAGDPERERLGRQVKDRREELGLSIRSAAKLAGISAPTWTAVEEGKRTPHGHNARRVEHVLKWQSKAFDDSLAGRQPIVLSETEPEPIDPEDRVWGALKVKYEAWRAEKGPDQAWVMLRREATEDIRLIDERRRRHAERDRRDTG